MLIPTPIDLAWPPGSEYTSGFKIRTKSKERDEEKKNDNETDTLPVLVMVSLTNHDSMSVILRQAQDDRFAVQDDRLTTENDRFTV